jgi:hypothetical protein
VRGMEMGCGWVRKEGMSEDGSAVIETRWDRLGGLVPIGAWVMATGRERKWKMKWSKKKKKVVGRKRRYSRVFWGGKRIIGTAGGRCAAR